MAIVGSRVLVITGGSSGIGRAAVQMANHDPAFGAVIFAGTRHENEVQDLVGPKTDYLRTDVSDRAQVDCFVALATDRASQIARNLADRSYGLPEIRVVACAGISKRGDPNLIQQMYACNVDGTRYLFEASADLVRSGSPASRDIGLGSIVDEHPLPEDEEYAKTKLETRRFIDGMPGDPHYHGICGITVRPGAIDTPMTHKEAAFEFLMIDLVRRAPTKLDLLSALSVFTQSHGISEEMSANDIVALTAVGRLKLLLGEDLFRMLKEDERTADRFEKSPDMSRRPHMTAIAMKRNGPVHERVKTVLKAMDLVVEPEIVAQQILSTTAERGVVNVFNQTATQPALIESLWG